MKLEIDDLGVCGVVVDDWAIEKSFKPKTITTDYNSWIAYISRRAVPANTPITDTYYWKPLTRLSAQLAFDYNRFKEHIESIVYSFIHSTTSGIAFDNKFGDSTEIGVNQKTLTEAVNRIWAKIEDITGETMQGISLVVSPEYFIGENGATVTISANTVDTTGIFEHIEFQINGSIVAQADNIDTLTYRGNITETSIVKVVAKILGIEYTQQKVITHYNSFFLGCGSSYEDIINVQHVIPIINGMRGHYDITANTGDHIYVIVGDSLASGFLRADMNGVEIPFTENTVTVDGVEYKVFTSENTYNAGVYNIDING